MTSESPRRDETAAALERQASLGVPAPHSVPAAGSAASIEDGGPRSGNSETRRAAPAEELAARPLESRPEQLDSQSPAASRMAPNAGSHQDVPREQEPNEEAPFPSPAQPMTYSELTERGYGASRPDILWVPYIERPPFGHPSQPDSSPREAKSPNESHKRQLSNQPEGSPTREKKTRDQQNALTSDLRLRSWKQSPQSKASPRGSMNSPQPISSWDSMPEAIMHIVFNHIDLRAQQKCRLVSKYWNQLINNNLKAMQPSKARFHTIETKFKRLTSVDFSRCEQLRNRNLHVLATSSLVIKKVVIGHTLMGTYSKPRVTNKGLEYLASMGSLRSLTFVDCNAFTNTGIDQLSKLSNLEELRFVRCTRVSEKGMGFLQKLPSLKSLTVFTCPKVSDGLLSVLKPMTHLRHLHLGHVRLTRERLEELFSGGEYGLEEFTIHGVELTAGSLIALGNYTRLEALGMTACYQVDTTMTMSTLKRLTNIQRLNLMSIEETLNSHFVDIADHLPNLQHLKVVLSSEIMGSAIESLARLTNLQACSFESTRASPLALHAVSSLTNLTCAEFPGTSIPNELLNALPYLPNLQHLSLRSHPQEMNVLSVKPLWIASLEPLLRCLSLKSLDMSYTDMNITLTNALLTKLISRDHARKLDRPMLEQICMHGALIKDESIATMNKYFPFVHCHRNRSKALESSTWVGF